MTLGSDAVANADTTRHDADDVRRTTRSAHRPHVRPVAGGSRSRGHSMHRSPRGAAAALVRRLIEQVCNGGNLAALDAALAPSPRASDGGDAGERAVHRLRPLLAAFQDAVPDAHWTVEDQVASGDTVVTRLAVRGAFSGPLFGLAPPGRLATLTGVAFCR